MIIDVDIKLLTQQELTPNEYIFLFLLYEQKYLILQRLLRSTKFINEYNFSKLLTKNLITIEKTFDISKLQEHVRFINTTDIFKKTIQVSEGDPFDDILKIFPNRVVRQDGRPAYLHNSLKKSRIAYNKIVKNHPQMHQNIIKCLKFEIAERTSTDSLKWMRSIPNWIDQEEWKIYERRLEEDQTVKRKKLGYGNELV